MYDPTVGRWLNLDPLGFDAGDGNPTRYIGNGPTNATDPSGLQPPWLPGPFPSHPPEPSERVDLDGAKRQIRWHLDNAPAGAQALTFVSANTADQVNPFRDRNMQIPVVQNLADLEQQMKSTGTLAALEIIGHAQQQEGVSIGTDLITPSNVAAFIAALKRMPFDRDPRTGKLKGVLILTSCCLGCYTRSEANSLVRKIANATGLVVLSPGGFGGNGSFLHPKQGDAPDTTMLSNALNPRSDLHHLRPRDGRRTFPSMDNRWYITRPW